jgi:hypothetical protein
LVSVKSDGAAMTQRLEDTAQSLVGYLSTRGKDLTTDLAAHLTEMETHLLAQRDCASAQLQQAQSLQAEIEPACVVFAEGEAVISSAPSSSSSSYFSSSSYSYSTRPHEEIKRGVVDKLSPLHLEALLALSSGQVASSSSDSASPSPAAALPAVLSRSSSREREVVKVEPPRRRGKPAVLPPSSSSSSSKRSAGINKSSTMKQWLDQSHSFSMDSKDDQELDLDLPDADTENGDDAVSLDGSTSSSLASIATERVHAVMM